MMKRREAKRATNGEEPRPRGPVGRPKTIDVAQVSLAQLLMLIRGGRATTRLDLERQSDLTRAIVTDRLGTLETLGLVEEGDLGASSGGRAPRQIQFRASEGALLVGTIDRSSVAVGVADLTGRLLIEHHEAADLSAGPFAVVDRLTTLFLWLMEEHGGRDRIWGVGIAIPGPGEMGDGGSAILTLETLREWQEFNFVAEMAVRFGAPVFIRSGVQMMTMGELISETGAPDMLFVKLGGTISAGLVCDGRLHRGAQGAAGMIGHTPTGENSSVSCHCGSRGCLEAVAGGDAIARQATAGAREGRSDYLTEALARGLEIAAVDVAHGAQLGDAFCAELMARSGRLIGESLAPLVNLLNPSLMVLGGSAAQSGDILLAAVREGVYRQSHPLVTRDLRIERSRMGASSGLLGAAHVVAEELFTAEMLQSWISLGTPRRQPELLTLIKAARSRNRAASSAQRPAATPS
jgi:predicted NBD/HSP70 family sugar kinase